MFFLNLQRVRCDGPNHGDAAYQQRDELVNLTSNIVVTFLVHIHVYENSCCSPLLFLPKQTYT